MIIFNDTCIISIHMTVWTIWSEIEINQACVCAWRILLSPVVYVAFLVESMHCISSFLLYLSIFMTQRMSTSLLSMPIVFRIPLGESLAFCPTPISAQTLSIYTKTSRNVILVSWPQNMVIHTHFSRWRSSKTYQLSLNSCSTSCIEENTVVGHLLVC